MGALSITDRGYRYRANNSIPEHPKVCAFCGARPQQVRLMVAHLDGHEENGAPDNLSWSCRPCNTLASNTLKNAGIGRLTRQFNPTKGGGAANVGEWVQAVGAITPHIDKGDRGLASSMSVAEAVAMIRATSHSKRSEFASKLRHNPTRKNLFGWGTKKASSSKPARRSSMTFVQAMKQARQAGFKGLDFRSWLDQKGLSDRSEQIKERLGDSYRAGMDDREQQDDSRAAAKERKLADQRNARFLKESAKRAKATAVQAKESGALIGRVPTEAEIKRAYERGAGSLREALEMAGAKLNPAKFDRCVKASGARKRGKRNPAGAAAEVFEEFHGEAPTETVTVKKTVHFHEHLASAGVLKRLVIKGIDYRKTGRVVTLKNFGGALLAFNEGKNQLFVEGGDQKIDLKAFGIDAKKAHELETLGRVTEIDYHTTKTHLGDEGGTATYQHGFRMTNENGEHVTVKIARYPDLIYSVPNEQLMFSGGSYLIRAEGIDL